MPAEGHGRLTSQAEPDCQPGEAPRVQRSCAVGLEEILPGPRTATDLYAWAICIDDKFLARQPIVTLWTSHLEGACPTHGEPVWHPCRQAGKGLRKLGKFFLHCKPNRAMQATSSAASRCCREQLKASSDHALPSSRRNTMTFPSGPRANPGCSVANRCRRPASLRASQCSTWRSIIKQATAPRHRQPRRGGWRDIGEEALRASLP